MTWSSERKLIIVLAEKPCTSRTVVSAAAALLTDMRDGEGVNKLRIEVNTSDTHSSFASWPSHFVSVFNHWWLWSSDPNPADVSYQHDSLCKWLLSYFFATSYIIHLAGISTTCRVSSFHIRWFSQVILLCCHLNLKWMFAYSMLCIDPFHQLLKWTAF